MNKKSISSSRFDWLKQQLASWQSQGLIEAEQQTKILQSYQPSTVESSLSISETNETSQISPQSHSWVTGILVTIGALLIGGGIILLFAHNWQDLGKGVRTILSFLPLILAQGLCFYSYKYKFNASGWNEGAATFLFMAIAASIALIGQTYHIYGDLERFVLTWLILSIPIAYLMRSSAVLIFSTILIVWLCTFQGKLYWLFFITLIPLWIHQYKRGANAAFYWSVWLAAIGFVVALLISVWLRNSFVMNNPLLFLLLISSAYYLAGKIIFGFNNTAFWKNPLTSLGAIGVGWNSLTLTFIDSWGRSYYFSSYRYGALTSYVELILGVLALVFIIYGLWRYWKQLELTGILLTAVGLLALLSLRYVLISYEAGVSVKHPDIFGVLSILMNVFVFVTSILLVLEAIKKGRMLLLNAGLLWFSSLIMLRFFDSDLSFIIKGIVFILIGACFIGVNIWFSRQHKQRNAVTANGGQS